MSKAEEFLKAIQARDAATAGSLLAADPTLSSAKNERGQSAVLLASYSGLTEVRDALVRAGAAREIYEAAAAGDLTRVKSLVDKDPTLAKSYSPDGFPVLALACVFGHKAVAELLLRKGADVNAVATNPTGYTALTGAVASGHAEIAEWLVQNGANVNYRYATGYTPLLTAAANGRLEIVRMLLDNGADLHAKTNDGKDALTFAEERKHKEVADFLKSRGLTH